ncbi:MAG: hypothetical protein JNL01_15640 [Bdellovibrionales bacterium]|nr:hypothetical protein [Bdellovibrionales bacterium]
MAQYDPSSNLMSGMPSPQGWIHELARGEIHPEAESLLNLGKSFDPQQLIEESTIEFLNALREQFQNYAKVFNSYSEGSTKFQEIKVYQLAQSPADFMIYRNQIKLVISNVAHGVINLTFAQHNRSSVAINGQNTAVSTPQLQPAQDLLVQVGAFRDIRWTFQGEKVLPEQIAKFYFAEFVKATRENKRTKLGNQALLDQIKQLLQQKGLDL